MNLTVLLEKYLDDPRVKTIAERIAMSPGKSFRLTRLYGSASQFVMAATYNHQAAASLNHLIILNDAEEAAYFHNTLENLTKAIDLFYFPSSFKNRKNFRMLNSSHVMLRTEALTRFSHDGNRRILITYPEALFEKVVLPSTLSKHIIRIKTNDILDVNALMEQFVGYGFERTDFVYQPGQFAMRGGILDIYSFGNDKPYRIELFGNDVDSIRIFDPESQLSERKLLQVTIIPNVETQFDDDDKISLLEYLPENTVVWIKERDVLHEVLLGQEEDLSLFMERSDKPSIEDSEEGDEKKEIRKADFVEADDLMRQVQKRTLIEFGGSGSGDDHTEVISFNTKEQPAFNRKFDMLINDLKVHDKRMYSLFLFADNPRQLERLHSIFTDLKAEIQFTPVPVAIHEGFIDEDLKVVCYTDHQIFQRYINTRSSRLIIKIKR
jgi:transcription-repair coupling factor (superfamily II helicase)